ncbi:MAG: hypothetical protein MZU84_05655 [Sphingobacterium sp.]|nr:hypothetical protein [Sphingobacterium sp.]
MIYRINERDRLHLRDRRHAAVPDQPTRPWTSPSEIALLLQVQHRRRAPHRPQAVPGRQHPHRLPAHRRSWASTARSRFSGQEVRIIQLGLEEDACREVSDVGHRRDLYHRPPGHAADRDRDLPDMLTPEEVGRGRPRYLRRLARSHRQGAHRHRRRPRGRQRQRHAAARGSRSRACPASPGSPR